MTTQELKDELKRRETKHNVKIGPMKVALNIDEMQEVFDQILVHLTQPKPERPPNQVIERRRNRGWVQPPINVPNWPLGDKSPKTPPYPGQQPTIWCYSKPEEIK